MKCISLFYVAYYSIRYIGIVNYKVYFNKVYIYRFIDLVAPM